MTRKSETQRLRRRSASRKNQALRRWLVRFAAQPDDRGQQWWQEFDDLLRRTRMHVRPRDACVARFVLDTNIISQILRRNAAALARLTETADNDDDLFMCPVVFYELWRGLNYRGADRPLEELNAFARALQWVDYDRGMWVEAAGLWAERRRQGRTHADADLLIAAFARRLRATLVTNNTTDFTDLDVPIVDWTGEPPNR